MHPPPPADDPTLIALAVDRVASALLADEQPQVKLDNYVYQGNVVHCDRYIYLPQSMLTQFERLECKTFSGILPEINRVYITIDNRLFLFNYIDGSIYAYQDFNQIVISVALVTPKPDVFIDEIEYLLAVATPSEIVILGVRFDGGSQTGNIELVETSYYTCSDGVHMLKLVCTPYPSSRIFAAGKDGRVYEIDYQPGTRWFSKKCRKLSHMSLIDKVSVLFPVLKLFQTHDPLIDLIVDPRKANLYGLTQASSVCKYELGQDLYDRCQGPYSIDAGRLRRSLGIGSEPDFAIVALSVDHGQYGVDVCAITNHGHRIYLKSNPGDDLVIDSIRICPRYIDAPSTEGIRQQYKPFFSQGQSPSAVKNALYVDGAFVAADMRDPRFDTLIVMTVLPSAGHSAPSSTTTTTTAVPPQPIIVADENVESHVLDCRVHDMKAIPQPLLLQQAPLAATLYRSGSASTPLIGLSSMAIQHAMPPPKFVVLTATRVMFFGLSRPLEQLTQILSTSSSAAAVQAAMGKFGMAESCAMLLTIICSSTAPPASEKRTVPGQSPGPYTVQERRIANANIDDHHHGAVFSQNQVVRQAAIDAFMSFGGEPSLKLKSLDHNVCYSHAHNALYMFASRVIRSIWFRSLVEQDQRELIFRYTPPIIGAILRPLMQLQRFINEYQIPQSRLFQSHDVASGTLELTSIGALEKFLSHTIEILQLVGIIQKTDTLSQITQIMDSGDRFVLESNSFKDLVVTSQGTRCIKGLIRSFLEVEGPGCSSYITSLQSMCPSFIDSTDLFLFNGNQLLAESGNQSFQGKATKLQREAIESFKKASANIDFPLQNVIPKLMDKGLLNDAITLCLWRASSLEKVTSSDSMMAEDDRMYRQTIAVKQKVAYQTACSCLDDALFHPNSAISQQQITAALTVCLQSTCATFLNDYFFPFYVQKCSVTYDVKSEKFQQYLVRHRLFDRLRQYFVALRKFQEGAKFFAQLPFNSEMTGNQITVRDRIRYLEIAVELNRYCSSQDDSLVFELRKAIELGEIQSQLISHLMAEKSDISEHGSANATSIALDNDLALCMSCLLNGEKLYTIGCRYSQFETCLKILCVEDSRQHGDVVAALYANIISSIIKERESLGADWRLAVKETIARLGRQYRLSTFMFPASLICELLEQYNITRSPSASQAAAPFVGPLMLDQVNYPVDQMIAIYSHLVRHWTLSRDGLYASILYILSPSHVDALSSNTLLFQKTVASAIDLCDLCLSLPDNTFADQFRRMRQLFMKKKSLAS